jgi:hypothetical protein
MLLLLLLQKWMHVAAAAAAGGAAVDAGVGAAASGAAVHTCSRGIGAELKWTDFYNRAANAGSVDGVLQHLA